MILPRGGRTCSNTALGMKELLLSFITYRTDRETSNKNLILLSLSGSGSERCGIKNNISHSRFCFSQWQLVKIILGGAVKSAHEAYDVRFNSHPKTSRKSGYLITFVGVSALQKINCPQLPFLPLLSSPHLMINLKKIGNKVTIFNWHFCHCPSRSPDIYLLSIMHN